MFLSIIVVPLWIEGGITLEEGVLIGPKVNLITINHPLEPHRRHSTISSPILIKKMLG